MHPIGIASAIAAFAVVLAGCGDEPRTGGEPKDRVVSEGGEVASGEEPLEKPPPVVVSYGGTTLTLDAWTTCWTNYCADGAPPAKPDDLGRTDGPITVEFPLTDWEFEASLLAAENANSEDYCDLSFLPATVLETGANTWELTPAGPAGTYRFDLSGRGGEGDVVVSFLATTTQDHGWPAPEAGADSYLWDEEKPATFAFEFSANYLKARTADATASVFLIGDGEHEVNLKAQGCQPRDAVRFAAELDADPIIDKIGGPPYDLRFELVLAGVRHVATAGWPPYDDAPKDYPEHAVLEFSPPLPGH